MLQIHRKLITRNYTKGVIQGRVKYIVLHYFGGLATAPSVANFFGMDGANASAHYVVDDENIIQCVDDLEIAWHCGSSTGIYTHPNWRNSNSIGIEIRPYKIDVSTANRADAKDWYFQDKTIQNVLELVAMLMKLHNIPIENVVRHYDVTGKYCPRPFMGDDINTYYNQSGNTNWNNFKTALSLVVNRKEETETITGEQIYKLLMDYMATLPTSDYTKTASQNGIKSGVFKDGNKDGLVDNPRQFLTREDLALVLDRLGLLNK